MLGFFQNIGATELIVVLGILVLIFGATKIPSLARALGKSVKEFKKGIHEDEEVTKETEVKKQEDKKEA